MFAVCTIRTATLALLPETGRREVEDQMLYILYTSCEMQK